MKMQIGAFLARRLAESGVRHIFGVPGDFNLPLLEQIEAHPLLEFTGNCNELNAAYAADGYARTAGISALVTTYGVGDLSAINGIAGAYAENVPVVHITGAPPLHAMNSRALLHHTLADGAYGNVNRCMAEFTVAQARITPANALFEIDRVLNECWLERRPVHLQIPSDVTHLLIDTPKKALVLSEFCSDPEQLEYARKKIVDLLRSATSTTLLIDAEVGRFGVADLVFRLAEKWEFLTRSWDRQKPFCQRPLRCSRVFTWVRQAPQARALWLKRLIVWSASGCDSRIRARDSFLSIST